MLFVSPYMKLKKKIKELHGSHDTNECFSPFSMSVGSKETQHYKSQELHTKCRLHLVMREILATKVDVPNEGYCDQI